MTDASPGSPIEAEVSGGDGVAEDGRRQSRTGLEGQCCREKQLKDMKDLKDLKELDQLAKPDHHQGRVGGLRKLR